MAKPRKNQSIVISALRAGRHFGILLRPVEIEKQSVVIEKRGTPLAVLLALED